MPLNNLIEQFLTYLEIEKNRSLATINNYRFYLNRFSEWSKNINPHKITLLLVRDFRLWLNRQTDEQGKILGKNTQNYHLIALRSFLKYLAKRDIKSLAAEKIELAKMPERTVEFLETEEIERLLAAPLEEKVKVAKKFDYNLIQIRDKAILETLFSTGLRVSELANLKREQVTSQGAVLSKKYKSEISVRGKGSKPRLVFLSESAKHWLKKYLDLRKDDNSALFIRHDRAFLKKQKKEKITPLTSRSIERLVKKYAKIAGLSKHVSPHTLRHSFATDLLQSNADLRAVQDLLGHSSITTTQIYTHVTNKHLREVHQAFHGRRRKISDGN